MAHWWETAEAGKDDGPRKVRAVAYHWHSAQEPQENSIPIQMDQVHEWANKNGVEITQEFAELYGSAWDGYGVTEKVRLCEL